MLLLEQPGSPTLRYAPSELTARSATITWSIDYSGNSAITGYELQSKQIFLTSKQQLDYISRSAKAGNQSLIIGHSSSNDQSTGGGNSNGVSIGTGNGMSNSSALLDQDVLFRKLRKESDEDEFWSQASVQFIGSNEVQESAGSLPNQPASSKGVQLIGQYTLNKLEPSNLYLVRLRAQNQLGFSRFSNTIFILTRKESPSLVPTNVTCTSLNSRSIRVSWQIPRFFSTDKKQQTLGQRISHQLIEGSPFSFGFPFGFPFGFLLVLFGLSLSFLLVLFGRSLGFLWVFSEFPLDSLSFLFLWDSLWTSLASKHFLSLC